MKAKINKNLTIDFICLVNNPELLLDEKIDWKNLEINQKVSDALKELHLAGCTIYVESYLSNKKIIKFLEKNDLIDFLLIINSDQN